MDPAKTPAKDDAQKPGQPPEDTDETAEYDPHEFRNVKKPTNNFETVVHILKGSLGTGILAMPEAFVHAGMLNGIVCTFLLVILCTFCLHMLIKTQYGLCKKFRVPLMSYPESMKISMETGPSMFKVFAKSSYYIVDFFLVVYQLGICCVYVVFAGVNIKAVVDEHVSDHIRVEFYILGLFIPYLLIMYIKSLKLLAPLSTVANIISVICFGIVLYYIFADGPMPNFGDRPSFGNIFHFPLYFGTTLFALEAVGVVIAVENNMKTPKSFGGWFGILNVSMAVVTILYVFMGMLGYWRFGSNAKPSITLNLPVGEALSNSVKIMYSIAIYISYALQGYVAIWILWETYIFKFVENNRWAWLWEYVLRTCFVILSFILGATIPLLGTYISLFGSFCLSALGIVFPCLMQICLKYPDNFGQYKWILVRNIVLMFIGLLGLIAGSYTAIAEIVYAFTKNDTKS